VHRSIDGTGPMNVSFFSDLLATISERGRGLIERREPRPAGEQKSALLVELAEQLLSRRGEASGVAIASEILSAYAALTSGPRIAFFEALASRFGPEPERLEAALEAYRAAPSERAAQGLHLAAEPRRQELFRRLNLAPNGTRSLVALRADLLAAMAHRHDLAVVDRDLAHLFSSWFNRGFLVLRRIDWTTPAHILEKIIRYEAVHEISDWDDLRRRIEPPDRRCFAFFHPALVDEPLIFVEVALTASIPAAIAPILAIKRDALAPKQATTATFYSISNCQAGLAGVSFGNFLIKQVVEDLCRELPNLKTFVTLSPAPGFSAWLDRELNAGEASALSADDRVLLRQAEQAGWHASPLAEPLRKAFTAAAAQYFLRAKNASGRPLDPVARFHLGNGARLERLNVLGDVSPKGLEQSRGLMVNYLYDLGTIEKHHEAYANLGAVTASSAVTRALKPEPAGRAAATAS
jgi:malonyl-CoA decarboxylase